MKNNITILDIARLAGVGKSTVSRVLNDSPHVSEKARNITLQVIKETGFVPSKYAQSMRAKRSKMIGVIVAKLDSGAENVAVGGILKALYLKGYDAAIMESQFDNTSVAEHLHMLEKRNAEGIILFGFSGLDVSLLAPFETRAVAISINTPDVSSVNYDNQTAIETLMGHFYHQGHTNIAYLGVCPEDLTTGKERLESYRRFCTSYGLTPHWSTCDLSLEDAYSKVDTLLSPETQSILCGSDTLAIAVGKRLQDTQRTNISVGAVGNHALLRFMFPQIITVDLGYANAGMAAANQLIHQLENPEQNTDKTHLIQPCLLSFLA